MPTHRNEVIEYVDGTSKCTELRTARNFKKRKFVYHFEKILNESKSKVCCVGTIYYI